MFRLFDVLPSFSFTTVKQLAITTYKHDVCKWSQEFPKDLRPRIIGNEEILEKCLTFIEPELSAHNPCQNGSFVNTSRKLFKNRN